MNRSVLACICSCICLFSPGIIQTQGPLNKVNSLSQRGAAESELFSTDEVLDLQLNGNIRAVLDDRGDNPTNHPLSLSYKSKDGQEVNIPIQAKTRGHFRKSRSNCVYPPLLLTFSKKEAAANTLFADQDKIKLVMPCKDDNYVVKEWLVYKLYNLVTPKSFRARLVRVSLNDDQKKKVLGTFYGVLLEEEKQMAKRNQEQLVNRKLRPENTESNTFITMAVFEYMIGNTDWSVQYLQNIKLLATDSMAVPTVVPYDFDHAGIVSTPYALPAEELQMSSVRERRYRGYCIADMKRFDQAIAQFNQLKNDFYSLYTHCPLLDQKYIKSTTAYLDDFYKTINDPKSLKKEFGYPCDPNGTGNVVIKGLREE
ncbi:MAG: hypothetical protein ACHQEM_05885 [Chitinophagales bacterium]